MAVLFILQSHVQANLYYISYVIEPMLELLWSEDSVLELTKYKVYFTIATNVLPHPPQLVDSKSCLYILETACRFHLNMKLFVNQIQFQLTGCSRWLWDTLLLT